MNCPNCFSDKIKHYLKKEDMDLYKCKSCKVIFLYPQPDFDYGKQYFEDYGGEGYENKSTTKGLSSSHFLDKIEKYMKGRNLLEVGSALGFFLLEARKRGWTVFGIDKSSYAREQMEDKFDIPSYLNLHELSDKMDAVVMINTIEHLDFPGKFLKELNNHMNSDGVLLLTTPNFNDIRFLLKRKDNVNIEKQHNFYFNTFTLKKILNENGFEIIEQRCPLLSRIVDTKIKINLDVKKKIMKWNIFKIFKKFDNTPFGTTIELIARKK